MDKTAVMGGYDVYAERRESVVETAFIEGGVRKNNSSLLN